MGLISVVECDGCGIRHEDRENRCLTGWFERRILEGEGNITVRRFFLCSPACWVKALRKEADKLDQEINPVTT
jgi:hypothetical protein